MDEKEHYTQLINKMEMQINKLEEIENTAFKYRVQISHEMSVLMKKLNEMSDKQ